TNSMEHYKAMVDKLAIEGGWLIFMSHVWFNAFNGAELTELVNYIRSKGIDIVSPNKALNTTGNIIQVGDYTKGNEKQNVFVVGSDGTVAPTRNIGNVIAKHNNELSTSMKPSDFPLEQI